MKQYLNFSKQIFLGVAILLIFHAVAIAKVFVGFESGLGGSDLMED